jgi:hypothetical protein
LPDFFLSLPFFPSLLCALPLFSIDFLCSLLILETGLGLPVRNELGGVVVDGVVAWWLETGLGFLLILETGLGLPVGNGLGGVVVDSVVAWWLETGLGLPISAWWSANLSLGLLFAVWWSGGCCWVLVVVAWWSGGCHQSGDNEEEKRKKKLR